MKALGGWVLAFHLVKIAGLAVNLVSFPTLARGDRAPGRPRTSVLVTMR